MKMLKQLFSITLNINVNIKTHLIAETVRNKKTDPLRLRQAGVLLNSDLLGFF